MARTKKENKVKTKTPKLKKKFQNKKANKADGSTPNLSRRRRRALASRATVSASQQSDAPNMSNVLATAASTSSQCFYYDTTPATTEAGITNEASGESVAQKIKLSRQQKRRILLLQRNKSLVPTESSTSINSVNTSQISLVPVANSTALTPPTILPNDAITPAIPTDNLPSDYVTPCSRRDSRRGKSAADKVRQKWRKYTKERLQKTINTKALTGVSPNSKAVDETKSTILKLLGNKTNEFGEFNSTDEYDANLLQDLDLVILAASPAEYEAYTKLLRQEYAGLSEESYKQMRLKGRNKSLKKNLNQTEDLKFIKFRDELKKTKMILNSTARVSSFQTPKQLKNCSIISVDATPKTSETIEEGEIISKNDTNFSIIEKTKICDENDDDDCIVVEKTIEQIIIDDDATPNIDEEDDHQKEPIFFQDITGSPTLKFTPQHTQENKTKTPSSRNRRSCTAVLNSSDVIVLDETFCSSTSFKKTRNSMDDSVLFVSESTPDFIPLVSENVPQLVTVVRNPFSSKIKKTHKQSSNDTLFTTSEKKALESYNFNTYNPNLAEDKAAQKQQQKRMVIIDGSNVAYSYSRQRDFCVKGIEICIEYFTKMGHEVKAVVPQMRLQMRNSTDPATLDRLSKEGTVVLTPCKNIPGNHKSSSYDDRFILQLASQLDAAIVSNDNYRDLINENAAFKKLILNRVIGYTWVNDLFMLPKDPYGKYGPTLHEILNRNPKKP